MFLFCRSLRAVAMLLLVVPSMVHAAESADKPRANVILLTADHMGTVHLAANGYPHMQTPNMDRLASTGVSFQGHYTVGVACMPNRASLFTGRYCHSHGVMSNGIPLPESEVTLTHILSEAGYHTGQMGKLHVYPGPDHPHQAQQPEALDVGAMNPKNKRL